MAPMLENAAEMKPYPYWLILNPIPMKKPSVVVLSCMVKGLFLSRKSAEKYLNDNRSEFNDKASVVCFSGAFSDLQELIEERKDAHSYH